jgi:4-carboxymuconolactone decarboxylase
VSVRSSILLLAALPIIAACDRGAEQQPAAQAQAQLPSDIHPVTLSRLPPVTPEDLDAEGRRLLAARPSFTAGPGPGQFSQYNPDSRDLGIPDGVNSPVGARYFQLAVMITAREIDQEYEWSSHAVRGLVQGVEQSVIDVVKYDRDVAGLSDKDATLITFGRTLLREHGVSSELWERMVGHFGRQQTVQILQIMGAYLRVGIMLNAVDQQVPAYGEEWWAARGCLSACMEAAIADQVEKLPPLDR